MPPGSPPADAEEKEDEVKSHQWAAIAAVLLCTVGSPVGAWAKNCIAGGCHAALVSPEFLHGPVAAEETGAVGCVSCHVPAGGACTPTKAGKFQLKTKPERLCLLCHDRGTSTQHTRTHSQSKCLSCHTPHSSAQSQNLLRAGK